MLFLKNNELTVELNVFLVNELLSYFLYKFETLIRQREASSLSHAVIFISNFPRRFK